MTCQQSVSLSLGKKKALKRVNWKFLLMFNQLKHEKSWKRLKKEEKMLPFSLKTSESFKGRNFISDERFPSSINCSYLLCFDGEHKWQIFIIKIYLETKGGKFASFNWSLKWIFPDSCVIITKQSCSFPSVKRKQRKEEKVNFSWCYYCYCKRLSWKILQL